MFGFSLFLLGSLVAESSLTPTVGYQDFGQPLTFKKTRSGQPSFNIAFDYEAEVFWMLTYEISFAKDEFARMPSELHWNLWSERGQKYVAGWSGLKKQDLNTGTVHISSRKILAEVLPWQRRLKWVIAVSTAQGFVPIYHVNLGELCVQYPGRFFDVARNHASCDVDPRIAAGWEQECHQFADNLTNQVSSGMISCRWATDSFLRQGCGVFTCPPRIGAL